MPILDDRSTLNKLSDNFFSLLLLQGVNYLVPLIVFPYLVRVLGVDGFGLYNFIFYVIWMGVVISDYGFDLSATKLISINRDDSKKIDEIFSAVMIIKSMLALLFLIFLTLLILIFEKFSNEWLLYYLAFGFVIGQALFPTWFFQGIERMRYITALNALSKLIFTLLIFVFIEGKEDLDLLFLFNSLGAVTAGSIALYIALKRFGVNLKTVPFNTLKFYLHDGWYIFLSRLGVEMYTSLNIILLGFFVNDTVLGYFSIVEKIIRAIGNILEPLTRAAYPYLSKVYKSDIGAFFKKNIQLSIIIAAIMIPLSYGVYFYGYLLLELISGEKPQTLLLEINSILVWILVIYLYGSQFTNALVILSKTKLLNRIIVSALIINIITAPIVLYFFGIVGFSWLYVFIGFFISFVKGYFVYFKFRKESLKR